MIRKRNLLVAVLAISLFNCEEEKVTAEVYIEPTLQDINLDGGRATFSYQTVSKRALYKVDEDRNITLVPFTFDGTAPNEREASTFDLYEVNHPDYFIISFDSLKHTYFVEKKTGKVHKTVLLDIDMYYGNAANIKCTSEALYYVNNAGKVHRVRNYLSPGAQIEILPFESNGAIFADKDETLFAQQQNFINRYAGGVVTRVLEGKSISSMWIGTDGNFRAMDFDGAIYQVTADTVKKEGAIPMTVRYVGSYSSPALNKTIGVQHRFNRFHIIELTPPYSPVVSYNAPPPPEGEIENIHIQVQEGTIYIHTSARTRLQRLLKIDATDFRKSTDLAINNTDRAFQVLPLKNDFLLTSICVYSHFACQEHLAFVTPSGEVEFAFDEGNFFGRLIRL